MAALIIAVFVIICSFGWLLYETNCLRVRLPYGMSPYIGIDALVKILPLLIATVIVLESIKSLYPDINKNWYWGRIKNTIKWLFK